MPSNSIPLTVLIAFGLLGLSVDTAAAENLKYTFQKKKDARAFEKLKGKWIVADGAYSASVGPLASRAAATETIERFDDFTAKVKFRMDRRPSDDPAASFQAGITFRGTYAASGLYSGYVVNMEIMAGGNEVRLRLTRANPFATLCNDLNVPVDDPEGWHTVGIEAVGKALELSFDGQSLCKVKDAEFRRGGLGFATSYDKEFDPGGTFSIDTLTVKTK